MTGFLCFLHAVQKLGIIFIIKKTAIHKKIVAKLVNYISEPSLEMWPFSFSEQATSWTTFVFQMTLSTLEMRFEIYDRYIFLFITGGSVSMFRCYCGSLKWGICTIRIITEGKLNTMVFSLYCHNFNIFLLKKWVDQLYILV